MVNGARRRALEKGLDFDLDLEWLKEKIEAGKCEATGLAFDLTPSKAYWKNPYGPSLDRIEAGGGYTKDNTRVVVAIFNMSVNEWGEETFWEFVNSLRTPSK